MKSKKCQKKCKKKKKCTGFVYNPNDRSCTLFLKRPNAYEPNSGERCFLQESYPVTCTCFSQEAINNAVDGIADGIYEVRSNTCLDVNGRKGVTFNSSPNKLRYSGFEIDQSGESPTCIVSSDQYFTLTSEEARQCMVQIENACSDLVAQTNCPASNCFSNNDMTNALIQVQTGKVQLSANSCASNEDGISFTYNDIRTGRRLAQVPGEYIYDTFGVVLGPPSCLRSDIVFQISPIEYLKCRSLIEDTCSTFKRPRCPCFTSNHVEYVLSGIQNGEIGFDSEQSCVALPGTRQIIYNDSRERSFRINNKLPTCETPFDELVPMTTSEANICLLMLDIACTVLKNVEGIKAECPCFTESDVSSAHGENSLMSKGSCDKTSESSLTLSYTNSNSDIPMHFGVYETPELTCAEQDTRRFVTQSEYSECKRILEDSCSKLAIPPCPCFNSKQVSQEVSNINNGINTLEPEKSCSRNREEMFGIYSKYGEDYFEGDGMPFSQPLFSINESSCRAHDYLILTTEKELSSCRIILEDGCETIDLPECPCFSSNELNLRILRTQNEFDELESCETDDESTTSFVSIEPYFELARGQRPDTKLRWEYEVRSDSFGLTCSRLDTSRVISPLEWKSCETKLQSVCDEVLKPKSETCPCFSSLELQQAAESVKKSHSTMDKERSCSSQPGAKDIFLNSGLEKTRYNVDPEALTCISPLLEEELDINGNEATVCQKILEDICAVLESLS